MKLTTLNIGLTDRDATAQRQARALETISAIAPAAPLGRLPVWHQPPPPPPQAAALATLRVWKQPPPPPQSAALASLKVYPPPPPPKPVIKPSLARAACYDLPVPVLRTVAEVQGSEFRLKNRQAEERLAAGSEHLGALADMTTDPEQSMRAQRVDTARKYREAAVKKMLLNCEHPSNIAAKMDMQYAEVMALKERWRI